jgi:hypothetical protein
LRGRNRHRMDGTHERGVAQMEFVHDLNPGVENHADLTVAGDRE